MEEGGILSYDDIALAVSTCHRAGKSERKVMKSWNRVCHQGVGWAKKHRRLLALAVVLVQACALPGCSTSSAQKPAGAAPRLTNGPEGWVIHYAGQKFHHSYDQGARPVGGMEVLRAKLHVPGEFHRDAEEGEQGKVRLVLWIRADGLLQRATLEHSDHEALDHVVVDALRQLRWVPAKKNGKPVGCVAKLPVTFKFREE